MPDDERARTPTERSHARDSDSGGDDLDSLAGGLPSVPPGEATAETEEEMNLGALAAVGGQRPSAQQSETDARLSLAEASPSERAAAEPSARAADVAAPQPAVSGIAPALHGGAMSMPHTRATWIVPLVLGLGIGAGVAAAAFIAMSDKQQAPSAAAAPQVAVASGSEPAPAPPTAAPPQVAAAPAQAANEAAAVPAPAPPNTRGDVAAAPAVAEDRPVAPGRVVRAGEANAAPSAPTSPSSASASPSPSLAFGDDPLAEPAPAAAAPAEEPPAADKAAEPNADANAKTGSSMDALLDEALSPAARRNELARQQEAALAAQQLPLTPSREDVTQAMTVLLPAIRGCAMGQSGLATAAIVVRNDGRVAGVEISGAPFAGTPGGRCMEGVIRRARFAPFQQPVMRIKFPLAIQ